MSSASGRRLIVAVPCDSGTRPQHVAEQQVGEHAHRSADEARPEGGECQQHESGQEGEHSRRPLAFQRGQGLEEQPLDGR